MGCILTHGPTLFDKRNVTAITHRKNLEWKDVTAKFNASEIDEGLPQIQRTVEALQARWKNVQKWPKNGGIHQKTPNVLRVFRILRGEITTPFLRENV